MHVPGTGALESPRSARLVRERSRPPVAAVVAGVVAIVGALPFGIAALFGALVLAGAVVGIIGLPWTGPRDPGEVLQFAVALEGSLLAVGYFALLVTAIVRLLAHRDRLLLLVTGLPLTLVVGVVVSLTNGWTSSFVFLGPVAAALVTLWPSVDEWVSVRAPA